MSTNTQPPAQGTVHRDTPRTDDATHRYWMGGIWSDRFADFTRTLERENATHLARIKVLTDRLEATTHTMENLRADLKAGRYIHGESVIDNLKLVIDGNRAALAAINLKEPKP